MFMMYLIRAVSLAMEFHKVLYLDDLFFFFTCGPQSL